MMADLPVELWLETERYGNQHVLIPHVRSAETGPLHYQIKLTRESAAGTSRVQQGGEVTLIAGEAFPLARLSSSAGPAATCELSITLDAANHPQKSYSFDCRDK